MTSIRVFKQIEGETAILVQGGVYKEADLFTRGAGELYAKASGGFIRIYSNGATSKANLYVDTLQLEGPLYRDKFGKLCIEPATNHTLLAETPSYLGLPSD